MKNYRNILIFTLLLFACNDNSDKTNKAIQQDTITQNDTGYSINDLDTKEQSFQTLEINEVIQIELSNYQIEGDTSWTWFVRYLTKAQITDFCNKINSIPQFDTFIKPAQFDEFSLLVYFKNKKCERFNTIENIVCDYDPYPGRTGYKRLLDKDYFSNLWNNAYEPPCNCDVLVDPNKFQNNTLSNFGTILKDSGDFFLMSFSPSYQYPNVPIDTIWIKKNDFITTYLQMHSADTLFLWESPFNTSKIIEKIPEPDILHIEVIVTNCHKGWVKVRFTFRNKRFSGWLKYYCSNPYTTCT